MVKSWVITGVCLIGAGEMAENHEDGTNDD